MAGENRYNRDGTVIQTACVLCCWDCAVVKSFGLFVRSGRRRYVEYVVFGYFRVCNEGSVFTVTMIVLFLFVL